VFPSLSNSWVAEVISEFTQRYADIHLSVVTRASKDIIEAVDAKRVDLGISLFESASDTIDCREFMAMESVCVLPPTHELCRQRAIQVSDLKGEKLIGLINAESSPVSSQYNIIAGRDIGDAALKASSASAVCHLVAAGRGVSIVSAVVAREHAHLGIETRPLKPRIEQPVYLLRSRHRVYSPLVEMLSEQIANDAASRGRKRVSA